MSNAEDSALYTGSCLCGGIRFQLSAELGSIDVCYCQMCRKAQGGPLVTNASVEASAIKVTQGQKLLTSYESSPGERRLFCSRCGSPIYSERTDQPQIVRVRVGAINEPLNVRPTAHYYTASKCNWWKIEDSLPQFPTE
jgi:hypothetical protein